MAWPFLLLALLAPAPRARAQEARAPVTPAAPSQMAPDQTAPSQTVPNQIAPSQTVPTRTAANALARDARLSFTAESAARARAVLAAAPLEVETRAAALLALGGGRVSADLARIESALADGKPLERRAALFALGEMGAAGMPALERALAGDTSGLEEPLAVALVWAQPRGAAAAGARLDALAQGEDALAQAARALTQPTAPAGTPCAALSEYYELRWRAARAYGLVDGQHAHRAIA